MAYSVMTLAKKWECHPDTIYAMIDAGKLKSFKLGEKRGIRISDKEVERWEESQRSSSEDAASNAKPDIGLRPGTMAKLARARG